ncbi:hypothetical protein C8J57DRAFT_1513025 [Mycena rebaudengoi]|nr:hypothetical protein C8J57DRAFT_1513025 [Mycena rebaudengoi]
MNTTSVNIHLPPHLATPSRSSVSSESRSVSLRALIHPCFFGRPHILALFLSTDRERSAEYIRAPDLPPGTLQWRARNGNSSTLAKEYRDGTELLRAYHPLLCGTQPDTERVGENVVVVGPRAPCSTFFKPLRGACTVAPHGRSHPDPTPIHPLRYHLRPPPPVSAASPMMGILASCRCRPPAFVSTPLAFVPPFAFAFATLSSSLSADRLQDLLALPARYAARRYGGGG